MSVQFNLKGLENAIRKEAERIAKRDGLHAECPHCGYRTLMKQGANTCPVCGGVTILNIDFSK